MTRIVTILAVVAALALSACGGSTHQATPVAPSTTPTSPCARESGSYACAQQRTREEVSARYSTFVAVCQQDGLRDCDGLAAKTRREIAEEPLLCAGARAREGYIARLCEVIELEGR
jgi:hypothetical protein